MCEACESGMPQTHTEVIERVELTPVERRLKAWSWFFVVVGMAALGVIAGALAAGYR